MESMFTMLDTVPRVQDAMSAVPLCITTGSIEFKGVSFGYKPEERLVISNISFYIPGGRTCAIVGATGSGKVCFHFQWYLHSYLPTPTFSMSIRPFSMSVLESILKRRVCCLSSDQLCLMVLGLCSQQLHAYCCDSMTLLMASSPLTTRILQLSPR